MKYAKWLGNSALLGLAILAGPQAAAAGYPERPVKIVVAYGAGSGADTIARILGDRLAAKLKQSIVIDNMPGAGGELGTVAAASAAPDGYTLLFAPTTLTVSPHMDAKPKYDATKDFAPIMRVATLPMLLVSGTKTPFSSWDGLLKEARRHPDALNYATSGKGSPSHLEAAMLAKLENIQIRDVPYRTGSQALTDVISGEVSFYFPVLPAATQQVKEGRLKALAVGSRERSAKLPDVPTLAELLERPDYEATVWYGLLAPAGTPQPVLDTLAKATADVLSMPDTRQKIVDTGSEVSPMDTAEFTAFIAKENKKWGDLVRELNLQK